MKTSPRFLLCAVTAAFHALAAVVWGADPKLVEYAFTPGFVIKTSNSFVVVNAGQPLVFAHPSVRGGTLTPDSDAPCFAYFPTVTCPPSFTVSCQGIGGAYGSGGAYVYYDSGYTECLRLALECIPPSGSFFPVGTHEIQCQSRPGAIPILSCSFTITVLDDCPRTFRETTFVYDSFEYLNGSTLVGSGQNPGQNGGKGWTGEWGPFFAFTTLTNRAMSLMPPVQGYSTFGGSVAADLPRGTSQQAERSLDLTATNSQLWFSFVISSEGKYSDALDRLFLRFLPALDVEIGAYAASVAGSNIWAIAQQQNTNGPLVVSGEPALLVLQLSNATPTSHTFKLFVNPPAGSNPPPPSATWTLNGVQLNRLIAIIYNIGNSYSSTGITHHALDDIRIAGSWPDLNPPPASCLQIRIDDPPACARSPSVRIQGAVSGCTNVTKLVWAGVDAVEHILCENCGINPSFAIDLPVIGSCAETPFTVTAYDANAGARSQSSVVPADHTPPVLTCASNKTVECGASWFFDPPTATDDCCAVSNINVSIVGTITNSVSPLSVTRTWLATDCCSNSVPCSQTVTVLTNCPPACSTNLLVNGSFEIPGVPAGYVALPGGPAESDCNRNGIPDSLDIAAGRSLDRNFNAIADECEADLSAPTPTDGAALIHGWTTTGSGVEYCNPAAAPSSVNTGFAADGVYMLDLAGAVTGGGIRQIFATMSGTKYRVTFAIGTSRERGRLGGATLTATVAGVSRLFTTATGNSQITWEWKAFDFVATGSSSTLSFATSDNPSLSFVNLDDVRVSDCVASSCLVLGGPALVTVPCSDAQGAFVPFVVFATNICGGTSPVVACSPLSGSFFPIGTHVAICRATSDGVTNQISFPVTVVCTAPPVTISGNVQNSVGHAVPGILMTVTGTVQRTVLTDADGRFVFAGMPTGAVIWVVPSRSSYVFTPAVISLPNLISNTFVQFRAISPFEQWQQTQWPSTTPPAARLPEADPDGDGMANLLEYAFGSSPSVPDRQSQLRIEWQTGSQGRVPVLCFRLATYATDIDFRLEYTDRIHNPVWHTLPESLFPLGGSLPPGWPEVRIPIPGDVLAAGSTYWRLGICHRLLDCAWLMPSVGNGESLRVGFMNVQLMDSVAATVGEVLGKFEECCGVEDREGKIAQRVVAGDYDIVAFDEAWVDGSCALPKAWAEYGATPEEAVRARAAIEGVVDESAILRRIDDLKRAMGCGTVAGKARLIEVLDRAGYIHRVEKLDDAFNLQDSGLMLFSRFPFEKLPDATRTDAARYIRPGDVRASSAGVDWSSDVAFVEYPYDHCSGEDCLSAKGAGLVRIRNPYTGRIFTIAFTHLQANDDADARSARQGQVTDLRDMIATVLGTGAAREPVIILGDMNIRGSLSVSSSEREEWNDLFDPSGRAIWGGSALYPLADAWERQVATVGDRHAPAPPTIMPLPDEVRDRGLTGNANSGGTQRYDYLLMNDPDLIVPGNSHFCVQHLAVAFDLMGDPTANRAAFGFQGRRILSDHFGLVADINLRTNQSTPYLAHVEANLAHSDDDGTVYPAAITLPGGMQWWRFDAPGTYSFGIDPRDGAVAADFEYLVFSSRELSRPLQPVVPTPRTVSTGAGKVSAFTFHSEDAPLYVRVNGVRRWKTGGFALVARRHQCASQEDFCELPANEPARNYPPLRGIAAGRARWFRLQTECPTSGRPQKLSFEAVPVGIGGLFNARRNVELQYTGDDSALHHLAGTPSPTRDPISVSDLHFIYSGRTVFAQVVPEVPDPISVMAVRWTNNLTVFEPDYVVNRVPMDDDFIFDTQDDEFGRNTLSLHTFTAGGFPTVSTLEFPVGTLDPTFLDFNRGHHRAFTPALFPTVRILDDERLEILFTELDDTLTFENDHLKAGISPLALDWRQGRVTLEFYKDDLIGILPSLWRENERPAIPFPYSVFFSGFTRYEVYGWLGHHSRNPQRGCSAP